MFVIDCWKKVLLKSSFPSIDEIEFGNLIDISVPSGKRVLERLVINTENSRQEKTAALLRRYIREADLPMLKLLLRFWTGCDLLVDSNKTMTVEFMAMSEFSRRPVAITCSQTLQLCEQYNNYPEFRSELNSVLKSNIWVFDIS